MLDDIDDGDNDYDDFQPIRTMKNCDICSFIIVERDKRLRVCESLHGYRMR